MPAGRRLADRLVDLRPVLRRVRLSRGLLALSQRLTDEGRRWLAWQLLKPYADGVTFTREGIRWSCDTWDSDIGESAFLGGGFQTAEIAAVLRWARANDRFDAGRDVIVDVGANIGTTTMAFLSQTDCRVVAIEPVPSTYAHLEWTVAANGVGHRASVVRSAIAEARDSLTMVLPWTNSGAAEVGSSNGRQGAEVEPLGGIREVVVVPADRLESILAERGVAPEQVALVWSDTQGCEAAVIGSGSPLWAAGVPLFVELWPEALERQGGLDAFLESAEAHFSRCLTFAELAAGDRSPEPVTRLRALCASLPGAAQTDVLLLPPGAGRGGGERTGRAG